jgi:2-polyprenyl-3-methyl-5-hydroxy-6-metoxy-1,4-benzoquinol methylase
MSDILQFKVVDGIKCFSPEVASSYEDYPDGGFDLTDKNADSSFWVTSRNRLFKGLVQRNRAPTGKTKFLEIGCGTGDFIRHISGDEQLEITGSEVYLKGLVYAKKNQPDVDFIQFDVTKGRIGEQFDMITAFDVIEHIDDDTTAIANIAHMLRKDGVAIISVPQHMFLWSALDEIVKHKRRYSRKELVDKLKANGFSVSYATSFVFTLFPLMLVSRLLDNRRDKSHSDDTALAKRVKFPPVLNWFLDLFMRFDEALIRMGVPLPFGGTLLVVARKTGG